MSKSAERATSHAGAVPRGALTARRGGAALLALGVVVLVTAGPATLAAAGPQPLAGRTGAPLGGYTLSASGSGLSVTYEQPNLPIPANPSLEADTGYSDATFGSGPTGQAVASALYPGQVIASAGGQLGVIVPGAPALPNWPIQAHALYPQGPREVQTDKGPVVMEASTTAARSLATATMGTTDRAAAIPKGLVTAKEIGSTSIAGATVGEATSSATSSVHDFEIAGGLVRIGAVESTAKASSNGRRAALAGSTTVTAASVAGDPVVVTPSGVRAAGHDQPIGLLGLTPLQVLKMAGISLHLAKPTGTATGPSGSRRYDGIILEINMTTFDAALEKLIVDLPSQISTAIYQLPIPVPNEQILTVDLAWVDAQSQASPAFVVPPTTLPPVPSGGGTAQPGQLPPSPPFSATTPPPVLSSGTPAASAPASSPTPSGAAPAPSRAAPSTRLVAATGIPVVFHGIGLWLLVLGALFVGALVLLLIRADRAVAAGIAGSACRPRRKP